MRRGLFFFALTAWPVFLFSESGCSGGGGGGGFTDGGLCLADCPDAKLPGVDAGHADSGRVDARADSSVGIDASVPDTGHDTGSSDSGITDAAEVEADTVSVTLTGTSNSVTSAGSITLTATAVTSGTIGKIEFYEGATLIATKYASPANATVQFVEGDNGTHVYTAKAYTSNASATSNTYTVAVAIPADACGADKVQCVAANCPAQKCVAPTHVNSGFGAFARAKGMHDVDLVGAATFDTATGSAGSFRGANTNATIYEVKSGIGFVRIPQGGTEPDVALWVFTNVSFSGGLLTFTGNGAVLLASAGDLSVATGTIIDASAKGTVAGPGGFLGGGYAHDGNGCAPGKGTATGGGGGGFGSDGAAGTANAGGVATNCSGYALLPLLRGGSGGGGGDDSSSNSTIPFGGGGGGAVQLTAFGALTVDGWIGVGGGGGRTPEGNWRNGAGGGAGGAIFLESPSILVSPTAGLFANGGGGGSMSSGTGSSCSGALAQDGQNSLTPATGSHCNGAGGNGAAAATAATTGSGGGGGLGRIVLKTLPAVNPQIQSASISPQTNNAAYKVTQTL